MSMLPIPVNTNVTVVLGDGCALQCCAQHCSAQPEEIYLWCPGKMLEMIRANACTWLRDVLLCRVRVGVTCIGQGETKETLQEEGLKQRIDYTSSEVKDRATPQPWTAVTATAPPWPVGTSSEYPQKLKWGINKHWGRHALCYSIKVGWRNLWIWTSQGFQLPQVTIRFT